MNNAAFTNVVHANGASPPPVKKRLKLWPGLIFALLGAHVLFCGVVAYVATADLSFAVEPDYYRKAVDWDATAAQARANQALGWTLRAEIADEADPRGERKLSIFLADRDDQPLAGASAEVTAFHHARGRARSMTRLAEETAGRYVGQLPLRKAGWWEFRFTVQRGEQIFTYTDLREVAAAKRPH